MTPDYPGEPKNEIASAPCEPAEGFGPLTLEDLEAMPETRPVVALVPVDTAPTPRSFSGWRKPAAAAGVLGGGVLMLLVVMTCTGASVSLALPPSPPPVPVGASVGVSQPVAGSTPVVATAPAWTDGNRETWIAGSRRAVAYEVPADRQISVWMRTVRPSLVVRCEGNVLDVFVFTDSAAQIERDTPDHTVSVRFDNEEETSTRWPDADSHDALFAPDGAAFARRLAAAETLRFGFTPHNAEPATVQFAVGGLAPILARAAKQGCKPAL